MTTARTDGGGVAGNNKITFGRYKGYTFDDVYEMDESYVQFCLDEKSKGEAYCVNMKRFQDYCEGRRATMTPVAYMVSDGSVMEEGTDDDDGLLMYLDSGCNSTCPGQKWMERYERQTGYVPEWMSKATRAMTGIGGSTRSIGTRRLYVGLETQEGHHVPGELVSTEIENSSAPMLLSLQAQESLGLVVDFSKGTVMSQVLNCTFRAVRGKKNRLIGLRLMPGDYLGDEETVPVSMMADGEDEDSNGEPGETKMTHQVRQVPTRRHGKVTHQKKEVPTGAGRGRGEPVPPWRGGVPTPPSKKSRMPSSGPSSSSGQVPSQEHWLEEEEEDGFVMVPEGQHGEGAEEEEEIEVEVEVEPEDGEEEAILEDDEEREETKSEAEEICDREGEKRLPGQRSRRME